MVAISTLQALAQEAFREHKAQSVLTAIDARMGEVYWGAFRELNGLMQSVMEETVIAPDQVVCPEGNDQWFGMGTGWQFREQIAATVTDCQVEAYPRAGDIALLAAEKFARGEAVLAEQAMPVYLRDKVALKKSER